MGYSQLHQALMRLSHTGASGFEGFVRDALAEVTGQGFRLMKSGPQGGVDSIGDPYGSGLVVGMEGKHYGASTSLPLDQLKSKLRDAAEEFPSVDLWVLATTRSISGGDSTVLTGTGDELGIAVLILDWADDGAMPPPLAVLSAAAPVTVAHHLGSSAATDISAVLAHPAFSAERERVRALLTDPSIGLAAARARVRAWAIRKMQDSHSARTEFDSYATLEARDAVRIARTHVNQALDGWWEAGRGGPAAVLGHEGMGKTWAALAWWIERSSSDPDFPLTLVIPARDVAAIDGPEMIAAALHHATGMRDVPFWKKRLARWATIESGRPSLLVIMDGLNQNWSFKGWSDLLVSLSTPDWRGRVALALTCRPDHWHSQLKGLADSRLAITTIEVGRFDDAELDALLRAHGLEGSSLHPKLLELMRSPRLSGIAIERRRELEQGGEITPERLVFEDWRHRHHRALQAMSDEEFARFIARLGRDLQIKAGGLSRREILDRLSGDGENERDHLELAFSELIDGGWLERDEDGFLRLDSSRVPAALGLALLSDLRRGGSSEERREITGQALDPLQGSDLSVAILKHAATFATIDPAVPAEVRQDLLEAWLSAQNFSPGDFDSYWRLIGCAPDLFIRIAEDEWFGDESRGRADEVLVKGFGNAIQWPDVEQALSSRLLEWFSRYWLDPLSGEILGYVPDDDAAAGRRDATRSRAAAAAAEKVAARFGLELAEVDPERQAWGSYRAAELLSWLPRAPLISVLTAWSITRAILGGHRQFSAIAWVLRWNEVDPEATEAAVLARARELLQLGGEIARSAVSSLLEALATPAAGALHVEAFGAAPEPAGRPVSWPMRKHSRPADRPLDYVYDLDADPVDPSVDLPSELTDRLRELAAATPDEALLARRREASGAASPPTLALARWAHRDLGDLLRRRLRAALTSSCVPELPGWLVRGWRMAAARLHREGPVIDLRGIEWLPGSLPIFSDDLLASWRSLAARLEKQGSDPPIELQLVMLAGQPAREQIRALRTLRQPIALPKWVRRLLAPAGIPDVESLRPYLESDAPAGQLLMWLDYVQSAGRETLPPDWEPVGRLFQHPDAPVRAAAFKVAFRCRDTGLAERLAASGWSWSADMDREEAAAGSFALELSSAARTGQIADRVHPEVLGWLAEEYPGQAIYLERWARFVEAELDLLASASSRSFPRSLLQDTVGWDALVATYGADLVRWTSAFVDGKARHATWMIMERFPLMRALEAVEPLAPGSKAEVVTRGLRESAGSNFRSGDLYREGTTLSGPAGEEGRQLVLAEANDDAKLFDLAMGVQASGQIAWLIGQIERDLGGSTAGLMARGLTLAGFLHLCDEADQLWAGKLASPPAAGWLTEVHRAARQHYERYKWARQWFGILRSTSDDDEAFAAFELMVASLDGRIFTGPERPSEEELDGWPWRRQVLWSLGWSRIEAAAKSSREKLSKLYLASRLPLSNQSPRRR